MYIGKSSKNKAGSKLNVQGMAVSNAGSFHLKLSSKHLVLF